MSGGQRQELRVLVVLDGPDDRYDLAALAAAVNRDAEYEYRLSLDLAPTWADAAESLSRNPPGAVLAALRNEADLAALGDLRSGLGDTPLIVLVTPDSLVLARGAVEAGAHDYLVTTRLDADRLVRCIRYCLVRQGLDLELRGSVFVDPLTGLYNRRGFLQIADHQIRLSRRKGRGFTLAFADVVGLAAINERHGRSAGDRALRDAAEVLKSSFRDSDVLGRLENDDLIALAIETDDEDEDALRERLATTLAGANTRWARGWTLDLRIAVLHEDHDSTSLLPDLLAAGERRLRAGGTP